MKNLILIILTLSIVFAGCSQNEIDKPSSVETNDKLLKTITELPKYNFKSNNLWQVDLRSRDLSGLDINYRIDDLMRAHFDTNTKWPDKLPDGFNPSKIIELGKTPGLNIKKLHEEGITGKGVGIAIIDQILEVGHIEYKDRLKYYEGFTSINGSTSMHGAAVASIAVGKNTGVAPEADLYYIENSCTSEIDFTKSTIEAIYKIIETNKTLPQDNRIRVLSISKGWGPSHEMYNEITQAIEAAKKQGIFVITTSIKNNYGFEFQGLGRNPMDNPEDFISYVPGVFWSRGIYIDENDFNVSIIKDPNKDIQSTLYVPMDSRTTASPTGTHDYVFYREGGLSWSVPYIAGLYALAYQANPDITPEIFWSTAIETSDLLVFKTGEKKIYELNVVNPQKLIESIK